MPNIKINKFRGLLTDVNDNEASLDYFEYIDAYIRENSIESKRYVIKETIKSEGIVDLQEIVLDEDKLAIIKDPTKLDYIPSYKYDPQRFLLIAYNDRIELKSKNNTGLNKAFPLDGEYKKSINYEGKVYILTSEKFYVLKRINRIEYPKPDIHLNDIFLVEYYKLPDYTPTVTIVDENQQYSFNSKVDVVVEILEKKEDKLYAYITTKLVIYHNNIEIGKISLTVTGQITVLGQQTISVSYNTEKIPPSGHELKFVNAFVLTYSTFNNKNFSDYFESVAGGTKIKENTTLSQFYDILLKHKNSNPRYITELSYTVDYKSNPYLKELIFDDTYPEKEIYYTYVLDDDTELVKKKEKLIITQGKYLFKVEAQMEFRLKNGRYNILSSFYPWHIKAFRVYVKFNKETPPELVYELIFFDKDSLKRLHGIDFSKILIVVDDNNNTVHIGTFRIMKIIDKSSLSGIYLTQTVGLYEKEYLTYFDDFNIVKGIPFVISGDKVYYPTIGNGQVTKSYYTPIPGIQAELLLNINNDLGVYYKNALKVINVAQEDELLFFTEKDDITITIKDYRDYLEIPEGLLLLTSNGLFLYSGNNLTELSKNINEFIKDNYSKLNVTFNPFTEEVFLIKENELFIYNIKLQTWRINKLERNIKDLRYTTSGLYYIATDEYGKIELASTNCLLISKKINLNEPYIKYRINSIKLYGRGSIKIDDKILEFYGESIYYIPLNSRRFNDYIQYKLEILPGTVLTALAINFEGLKYDI